VAKMDSDQEGLKWQVGVWDRISPIYLQTIDNRFTGVVDAVIRRAALQSVQQVLDIGTGTGSVAIKAASLVMPGGNVTAVDISPEMLELARQRATSLSLTNVEFFEGRAEELPLPNGRFDIVLASLSLMYVIDRAAAAREIARVLRPGGRFVAAVWGGPEEADIVLFQQTAGSFAPAPPVPGVGPGALADPAGFLAELELTGIRTSVESETTGFVFDDFSSAWDALASVTTAQLPPERQQEAKTAVRTKMWPEGDGPRHFRKLTRFIAGTLVVRD
jgi:SAM-dependent methyltransferase